MQDQACHEPRQRPARADWESFASCCRESHFDLLALIYLRVIDSPGGHETLKIHIYKIIKKGYQNSFTQLYHDSRVSRSRKCNIVINGSVRSIISCRWEEIRLTQIAGCNVYSMHFGNTIGKCSYSKEQNVLQDSFWTLKMHIKVLCTVIKSQLLKTFPKKWNKDWYVFGIFCKLAQEVCKIAINKF